MSRGMIKAPIFLPPMGHGFGGGMPMMPPLPGGPPQMPTMPPGPPRQPTPQNGQEGGLGSPAAGGIPGQPGFPAHFAPQVGFGPGAPAPFQPGPGQVPFQAGPGQVPFAPGSSPIPAGPGLGFAPPLPFAGAPAFQAGMGLPFQPGFPGQFPPPVAQPDALAQQATGENAPTAMAESGTPAAAPENSQRRQFRRPGMYSTRQVDLQFSSRT